MRKNETLAIFTIISMLSGCSNKDNNDPPADSAATITITTPPANARYSNASTVLIRGNIDDQDILKNAKVEVKNKTSGAVLFTQTSLTGNLSVYSFNWSWPVTGIAATFTGTVKITSTDQYNYTTTKEVDIIFDP